MAEFFWNYIWPLIIMVAESLLASSSCSSRSLMC